MNRKQIVLIGLLVIIFAICFDITSPVYAARIITFEKTVDVEKGFLLQSLADVNRYPKIFSDNTRSVDLVDNAIDVAKMNVRVGGIFFDVPEDTPLSTY